MNDYKNNTVSDKTLNFGFVIYEMLRKLRTTLLID